MKDHVTVFKGKTGLHKFEGKRKEHLNTVFKKLEFHFYFTLENSDRDSLGYT